jgi:hypothetical protein
MCGSSIVSNVKRERAFTAKAYMIIQVANFVTTSK